MIQLLPNHVKAHYRRGKAQLALKDTDEAVKSFKRAAELDPTDAVCKPVLMFIRMSVGIFRNIGLPLYIDAYTQ